MALPYQGYGYNPYQYGQVNPLQPQMDRLAQMQAQYQQPQQMQQVNQGILWVQGEAGAEYDDLRSKYEELYSYLETATKPEGGRHGESLV